MFSPSAFTDKSRKPAMEEVFAVLGPKRSLWEDLARFVSATYGVEGDLKYYVSPKYGWVVWFRKSGRTLLALYPGRRFFTVQLVLNEPQVAAALEARLSAAVRDDIANARQWPEGRWVFLRVASAQSLADVKKLLAIKAPQRARAAKA